MIVTEEEAKTKWCPMVRSAHAIGTPPFNRLATIAGDFIEDRTGVGTGDAVYNKCIGSRCMMWKDKGKRMKRINAGLGWYNESHREKNNVPESWVFVESENADDMAYWEQPAAEADNVGCCGLIPRHE